MEKILSYNGKDIPLYEKTKQDIPLFLVEFAMILSEYIPLLFSYDNCWVSTVNLARPQTFPVLAKQQQKKEPFPLSEILEPLTRIT